MPWPRLGASSAGPDASRGESGRDGRSGGPLPTTRAAARVASPLWRHLSEILRGAPASWGVEFGESHQLLAHLADEDLGPLIYQRMAGTSQFSTWPTDVRRALRQTARAVAASELVRGRETEAILTQLGELGIRPLVLKGTALAYAVYEQPALRPRSDTDLLIDRAEAPRVRAALRAAGYGEAVQCDGELLFRQFEMSRTDAFGVHHAVDVHWSLSAQTVFAELFTFRELADQAAPVPRLGPNGWMLGPVHALVLSCMHPIMHHRGVQRLLWIYDTHLLATRLDAAGFEALRLLATQKGLAAVCAEGLELTRVLFGTAIPPGLIEELRARPRETQPTAGYLTAHRAWRDDALANVRALKTWRERLRLIREIALPSPAYMLRSYGMDQAALGPVVLPMLYVHRGVRGLWRALRGRK